MTCRRSGSSPEVQGGSAGSSPVVGPPPIDATPNPLTPDAIGDFDHFRSDSGSFAVRHGVEGGADPSLTFGARVEGGYSNVHSLHSKQEIRGEVVLQLSIVNSALECRMDGRGKTVLQCAMSRRKRIDDLTHFLTRVSETHEASLADGIQKG